MASNINIPHVELIIGIVTNDHAFEYQKNLPVEFPKWEYPGETLRMVRSLINN